MNDTTARQNLFAGIVTFNPDIELLRKNIEAICAQVDLVIIVDNGSRNLEDIRPSLTPIIANWFPMRRMKALQLR